MECWWQLASGSSTTTKPDAQAHFAKHVLVRLGHPALCRLDQARAATPRKCAPFACVQSVHSAGGLAEGQTVADPKDASAIQMQDQSFPCAPVLVACQQGKIPAQPLREMNPGFDLRCIGFRPNSQSLTEDEAITIMNGWPLTPTLGVSKLTTPGTPTELRRMDG
eukprot:3920352-Amphidinium_carterae.1